jgi:anti-anti-sigma factor
MLGSQEEIVLSALTGACSTESQIGRRSVAYTPNGGRGMRLIGAGSVSDTSSHLGKQWSILKTRDQSIKDRREVAVERFTGGVGIVSILGDIDSSSYLSLYDIVMSELCDRRCRHLIIDLTQVSFCSACGLSCLIQAHDAASNLGIDLRLAVPPSTALMSIWQLRDLRGTLKIVPTVAAATPAR